MAAKKCCHSTNACRTGGALAIAAAVGVGMAAGYALCKYGGCCSGGSKASKPKPKAAAAASGGGGGHGGHLRAGNDPSFPLDEQGRSMHVQTRLGDTAQRVVTVGDAGRAKRFANMLDDGEFVETSSSRGFRTYTGTFQGVPITIIATGMGFPMADFMLRELRGTTAGDMAVIRVGTCGGLGDTPAGTVVVASSGAHAVTRDPVLVRLPIPDDGEAQPELGTPALPYRLTNLVAGDAALSQGMLTNVAACLQADVPDAPGVVGGTAVSADFFYASQGRKSVSFEDRNVGVVEAIERAVPDARCLEMETFHIFDLASLTPDEDGRRVRATAAAVPLLNRRSAVWVDQKMYERIELATGRAALTTLAQTEL